MTSYKRLWQAVIAASTLVLAHAAVAAVPSAEAERLKGALTPLGGERAGNASGSIPAWNGGYTTPIPGFVNGGRRSDPFSSDKPLYSVTSKNMSQYAEVLSDGTKAMLQKYPDSFRIDVYPTRRTAAAPQWVYENTSRNATRASIVDGSSGAMPQGAYGGIPFPIPRTGIEVVWNHLLRWRGEAFHMDFNGMLGTANGKTVLTVDGKSPQNVPYYFRDGSLEKFNGEYWLLRIFNSGPPVRAGEGIAARMRLDGNDQSWVYLTGQRRVRKLPNVCCDTPTPATAGVMSFDEVDVFTGTTNRFDWKLVGKKELLIPYNANKLLSATDEQAVTGHHLNPDFLRWEQHRVWVVEATLKSGQRHQAPKTVYYFDEDTWQGALADRWDAKGQLWKTLWEANVVMPDLPGTVGLTFGFYDLISGASYYNGLYGSKTEQYKIMRPYPDAMFTPDGLISC